MTEPGLVVRTEGQVAILRLNDPKSMNALSAPVREGLTREVHRLLDAPDVRCLLITGIGDAFCAGGDIRAMDDRRATDTRARMHRHYRGWASRLLKSEKPVVMAVNGAAAGAGVSLALMGDIIIASRTATTRSYTSTTRQSLGKIRHRSEFCTCLRLCPRKRSTNYIIPIRVIF
jgi:2-(1,2-epoxy-1,2-dihydrophenyl)acetyl-CoA isomerase